MPLDLRGFMDEPNEWTGLYRTADQMEKRKAREDQLAQQKDAKRATAATFLQNYLDPKDMLTGTNYDPVLLQGLDAIKQQGNRLVMAGADPSMLMMALGPSVNKISTYSTNAKNINKRIDEQIKGMRDSGMQGYNYAALKQEALKNAFYQTDENGQTKMDPDSFDPSVDYVTKAIEKNPLAVTTEDVFDEFAKKAEKFKTLADVTTYDQFGTKVRQKANLISPGYMVPETVKDPKTGEMVTTGFAPKHDIATEQGEPLYHTFNKGGKEVREPVRMLDEEEYDKGLWPAMQHRIRGMVQQHLKEYSDKTGKEISIDSPEAKRVGRAIGYDLLNVASRKGGTIEHVGNIGQPSAPMINLRVHQLPEYKQNEEEIAAARKRGRNSEMSEEELNKKNKRNFGQALGDIFTGKEDLSGNSRVRLNGQVFTPDGKAQAVKDREIVNITGSMPGGGIKAGTGANHQFGEVYFDEKAKSMIIEQEEGPAGNKHTRYMEIPESGIGPFFNRYAEANGTPKTAVKKFLEGMGYSGGKFQQSGKQPAAAPPAPADPAAEDFNRRKKNPSWRVSLNKGTKAFTQPFGQSTLK